MGSWKLSRTKQCKNCPWRVGSSPHKIPGYSLEQHKGLRSTIAQGAEISGNVMACHDGHADHCIGWINNQAGDGNNLWLRLSLMRCENAKDIEVVGLQYQTFDETIPKVK